MPNLRDLKLSHPVTSECSFAISLLIRTDYYWSFVQDHIVRSKSPTAQQSRLGHLLSGPLPDTLSENTSSSLLQIATAMYTEEASLPNMEKFWSVEAIGTETVVQSPDLTFLQSYQQSSISQSSEDTCMARFPWKVDKPHFPSNIAICKKRTRMLVSKLQKTPDLLQVYNNIIQEQER